MGENVMDLLNTLNDTGLTVPEEDMDFMLEVAGTAREFLQKEDTGGICSLVSALVKRGLYESFTWVMEIIREEYSKDESRKMADMTCELGASIPDYDGFITALKADMRVLKNDVRTVPDENGEPQAFFNELTYRTGYPNIFLVTTESFDTRDNDYIRYSLLFTGSKKE